MNSTCNNWRILKSKARTWPRRAREKTERTGVYYRLMLEHIHKVLADIRRVYPDYDEKAGYELAGFVWFQGWNDMVDGSTYPSRGQPGSYDTYSENLAHFIRDVRKDLKAPKLPFVIGVMGAGGPIAKYGPGATALRGYPWRIPQSHGCAHQAAGIQRQRHGGLH